MNIYTGEIIPESEVLKLPLEEQEKYISVKRDITAKEHSDMQIKLYSLCACGSGKKFKFCCKRKQP